MSFDSLLIDSVTVGKRTAGAANVYGDATVTFPAGSAIPARVQQTSEEEVLGGRDTTLTWYRVFLPAGVNVDALDRVNWEGRVYEVDGEPKGVDGLNGAHHIELVMKRIDQV